jgi:hypothetical protein
MRKNLLLTSLLAIALLTLGSGLALACGGSAKTTSTASTQCTGKADATTASAQCPAGCSPACMAACTSAKTASAEGGHCSGAAMKTAGAGHCNGAAMKTADGSACAAKGDFFISNYMTLTAAMKAHCGMSSSAAASAWREGVEKLLASGEAEAYRENLNTLAGYLADWPSDTKVADARYRAISEWTAGYCQLYPEKTAGATVMTCPVSGQRWVEIEGASTDGDSQS